MKLSQLYQVFSDKALQIPNFVLGKKEDVEYDIDILANAYVKAIDEKDDLNKDLYFSALIIRYWHMILYFKNKSPNVDMEEIFSWICDGIQKACKYRGWLNDPKLIGKRKSAEKCINQAITSVRAQFYVISNAQKRKQEFLDESKVFLDSLEEREADSYLGVDDVFYPVDVDIVRALLKDKQYIDSVVVDLIMNGDCVTSKLSLCKLKKTLHSLGANYFDYFKRKYDCKDITRVENAISTNLNMSRFNMNQLIKRLSTNALIKDLHN